MKTVLKVVRDQSWKPDEETKQVYITIKQKLDAKKKRSKANRDWSKRKKADAFGKKRHKLIVHYGLHKYASDAAICYLISQEFGDIIPSKKAGYKELIKKTVKRINRAKFKPKASPANEFYRSTAWKELRYIALANSEGKCNLCGGSAKDGLRIHVDHIKPRSKFPEYELDLDNMQVLCEDCNIGKSNFDSIDWRI